jgi:hypothetical protein
MSDDESWSQELKRPRVERAELSYLRALNYRRWIGLAPWPYQNSGGVTEYWLKRRRAAR